MDSAFGITIARTLEDVCRPREMALLVYDAQVAILRQVKQNEQVLARAEAAVAVARSAGMRIVYTRHLSLPREWMGSFAYRMGMAWQHADAPEKVKPFFLRESPAFAIVPSLEPKLCDAVLDKIGMSAFEGTPLAMMLRDCGLRAIAIVGAATEVGIEPTCRHAADLGIVPVVLQDACGAGNPEAADRSLAALRFAGDTIVSDTTAFEHLLRAS
jgi:nicotinamidase-related amidase